MKPSFRNILAVVAGVVLGGLVNTALVALGPRVIPPPGGVDMSDPKSLAAGMHTLEPKHFLIPLLAHGLGTFVGAVVTHLAASTRRTPLAYAIGAFFLAGGIAASRMVPAPRWFIALDLVAAYLPMAWLGAQAGRRLRP